MPTFACYLGRHGKKKSSVTGGGGVCTTFGISEVHNELIAIVSVEGQAVVGPPCCQVLDLLPVGQFIVVDDKVNHCCVTCKLSNGIEIMHRHAVVGEESGDSMHSPVRRWCSG